MVQLPGGSLQEYISASIRRANAKGKYAAGELSQKINSRLRVELRRKAGVIAANLTDVIGLINSRTSTLDDTIIRVNTGWTYRFIKWVPGLSVWGLVNIRPEGKSFVVRTTSPRGIASKLCNDFEAPADGVFNLHGDITSHRDKKYELPPIATDRCFLCNATDDITDEHVFPRWLQRWAGIYHDYIGLLNNSMFRYDRLKVSACNTCNTVILKDLEDEVSDAFKSGYEALADVDDYRLFIWCAKIFLGLLSKETALRFIRSDPSDDTPIMNPQLYKGANTLRIWLSPKFNKVTFEPPYPFEVFVFQLQEDHEEIFMYHDSTNALTACIKVGNVGLIVTFMEYILPQEEYRFGNSVGEALQPDFATLTSKTYGRLIENYIGDHALHPIQFIELYYRISYQLTLPTIPPAYAFRTTKGASNRQPNLTVGHIPVPFEMDDWDEQTFQRTFSRAAFSHGMPVYGRGSFLFDENGGFLTLTDSDIERKHDTLDEQFIESFMSPDDIRRKEREL
jgi:hypothetical protein